jgi:hypothetical protein
VVEAAGALEPPLLGAAELPLLGGLIELLDSPEGLPWLGIVLARELTPVGPWSPSESFEHDTTNAGSTTHRVGQGNVDKSSLLMGRVSWMPARVSRDGLF